MTAAGLGFWRLTGPALWADELATWGAVRLSWSQLWQLSGTVDAVLLPYYAVMKVYTAVAGTGTVALRFPAVLAIVATTLLVTALGRHVAGDVAGVFSGLLFAVLPVVSRYGQEARPYAFVMLFATLALWLSVLLLEDVTPRRTFGYGAAVAAVCVAHPLSGLLMLATHAAAMFWRHLIVRPGPWRATGWWLAAGVTGAIPGVLLMLRGAEQAAQISWIKLVDLSSLSNLAQGVFVSATAGGIVLVLAALGIRSGDAGRLLAAAGFGPILLLMAAGTLVPIWVGRYAMVAVPALAVLAGLAGARAGRVPATAAIGVTALLAFPVHVDIREPAGHTQDSRQIATVIGPRYVPGDVAVFPDGHPSIPWAARDIYERYLPAPRPPDVLRVAAQRTDGRFLARECPAAACLGDPPRIWVIRVDNAPDPLQNMPPGKRKRIAGNYRTVQTWKFSYLGIVLMERSPAKG